MKALAAFILTFFLTSCASTLRIPAGNTAMKQQAALLLEGMGAVFTNETEKTVMENSLYSFLAYLEWRFGPEKLDGFMKLSRENRSFGTSFHTVYGTTVYQTGYEMLARDLDAPNAGPIGYIGGPEGSDYEYYWARGSAADNDLHLIETLLEEYSAGMRNILRESGKLELFVSNLRLVKNGRVALELCSTKDETGFINVAVTSIGLDIRPGEKGSLKITMPVSVRTAYFSPLSSMSFVHELAHVYLILGSCSLDNILELSGLPEYTNSGLTPVEIMKDLKRDPERIKKIVEAFVPSDLGIWHEGMAEYLSSRHSIFYRYGLFPDVDDELRFLCSRGARLTPLAVLDKNGLQAGLDYPRTVMNYQAAHSFVRFAAEKYGLETVMKILLERLGSKEREKLLGTNLADLETEWLEKCGFYRKPS